jgi:hypothetical protein
MGSSPRFAVTALDNEAEQIVPRKKHIPPRKINADDKTPYGDSVSRMRRIHCNWRKVQQTSGVRNEQ